MPLSNEELAAIEARSRVIDKPGWPWQLQDDALALVAEVRRLRAALQRAAWALETHAQLTALEHEGAVEDAHAALSGKEGDHER